MSNFSFDINHEDNIIIVSINGRMLDNTQTEELLNAVQNELKEDQNKIVLNLDQLDYINSSGLNCFINILTKARNMGGEVVVINVPEKIKKLLLISKLNTVFTIKDSIEEANEILIN